MEIIAHRRNTIEDLKATPKEHGVEVDIRSYGDRLIIHHDPFIDGQDFEEWLAHYRHGTLILNVKEEGLEQRTLQHVANAGVSKFFFLDQSFPFLMKTAKSGERRCAIRFSEFESIETVIAVAPMIDWVWIDCFTHLPIDRHVTDTLKACHLKICLVSPELQGRFDADEIHATQEKLERLSLTPDAVCTKTPHLWI